MKILIVLLLLLPSLIIADCGCEDTREQIERERRMDEENHACRSCFSIVPSADACPPTGYECKEDWSFTSNVLSPNDNCRCSEAKCAGNAKLFVDGDIAPGNKMRCNNSKWMVNDEEVASVICAKSCGQRACQPANRKALSNFKPLKVTDAGGVNVCAIGECETALTMMVIDEDGNSGAQLGGKVTCTSDGAWKDETDGRYKYVMCNTQNCHSVKCSPSIDGPGMESGDAFALDVTEGSGAVCSTAKCDGGEAFVQMGEDGSIVKTIDGSSLHCIPGGKWQTPSKEVFTNVMCQQPPCKHGCNGEPFESSSLSADGKAVTLDWARREDCSYSCQGGKSIFVSGYDNPVSAAMAMCDELKEFAITNSGKRAARIGCWSCDLPDEEELPTVTEPKPKLSKCVVSCPYLDTPILQYIEDGNPGTATEVPGGALSREVWMESGTLTGQWFDLFNEKALNNPEFACLAPGCFPFKCRTSVAGHPDSVEPLIVTSTTSECASAICPDGYSFVEMDAQGTIGNPVGGGSLTCKSGIWETENADEHEYVMCKKPTPKCPASTGAYPKLTLAACNDYANTAHPESSCSDDPFQEGQFETKCPNGFCFFAQAGANNRIYDSIKWDAMNQLCLFVPSDGGAPETWGDINMNIVGPGAQIGCWNTCG